MGLLPLGSGVYRDDRTGNFYERPTIGGRRTFRKLDAATLKVAKELAQAHRVDSARAAAGLGRSPYSPPSVSVGALLTEWESLKCPDRSAQPKAGGQLYREQRRIVQLRPFWQSRQADSVRQPDCHAYATRRKGQINGKRGNGGRAVDLELSTLSNCLRWAVSVGKLETNPLEKRPRFRPKTISHCRDHMPANGDELHELATWLFETRRAEPLGWQLLLEAMTGCRTSEILRLRWEAKPRQAGFIEGAHLWLERSKGGVNPFVLIHPALADCIAALGVWRKLRGVKSDYWVPGLGGIGSPAPDSLTHALRRISKHVAGAKRTSHGLRAFYVTCRRSQGIADGQIAAEIGDKSGAAIIVSTYGAVPPNWSGGDGLSWLPKENRPAWSVFDGMPTVCETKEAPKLVCLSASESGTSEAI